MGTKATAVLYVLAMVAVVVGVDVLLLQNTLLGPAHRKHRNRTGVRRVLFGIREASLKNRRRIRRVLASMLARVLFACSSPHVRLAKFHRDDAATSGRQHG